MKSKLKVIIIVFLFILSANFVVFAEIPSKAEIIAPPINRTHLRSPINDFIYEEEIIFEWYHPQMDEEDLLFELDISFSQDFKDYIRKETNETKLKIEKREILGFERDVYWRVRARSRGSRFSGFNQSQFKIGWCGDGVCDEQENCNTCPTDCGVCFEDDEEVDRELIIYPDRNYTEEEVEELIIDETIRERYDEDDAIIIDVDGENRTFFYNGTINKTIRLIDEFGRDYEIEKEDQFQHEVIELEEEVSQICDINLFPIIFVFSILIFIVNTHKKDLGRYYVMFLSLYLLIYIEIIRHNPGCQIIDRVIYFSTPIISFLVSSFYHDLKDKSH